MSKNNFTVVTIELRFPHVGDWVDLDGQEELESRVRGLRNNFNFAARILGCEPEEVNRDTRVDASVDFGAKSVQ